MSKTIAFDARLADQTGIGQYIRNILSNLPSDSGLKFVIIRHTSSLEDDLWKKLATRKEITILDTSVPWASLREQIAIPQILRPHNIDLFHVPWINAPLFYGGKLVTTVHDLTLIRFPAKPNGLGRLLRSRAKYFGQFLAMLNISLRSTAIIVQCNFVKDDLTKLLPWSRRRVQIIASGPGQILLAKGKSPVTLAKPYILCVGNLYRHKNLAVVIEAMAHLPEEFQLVLIGRRGIEHDKLFNALPPELQPRIHFTGFISDSDLAHYYKEALALIQPSLSEGFGLSGLEAMSVGTPVIAAEATCLPEVYGEGALFFPPHSATDLARRVAELHGQEDLRDTQIAAGKRQVKKYSWEQAARETLNLYLSLLEDRR